MDFYPTPKIVVVFFTVKAKNLDNFNLFVMFLMGNVEE